MTSGRNVWTFDVDPHEDVLHMVDHRARAVDGELGRIVGVSAQPNRGYILVGDALDDGEVILPAGAVRGHHPDGSVAVALTTDQVVNAPVFDAERRNDREYYEMLTVYFESVTTSRRHWPSFDAL